MQNIIEKPVSEIMPEKFMPYALGVIQDRALCDIRDGLKPIQRKILYDMYLQHANSSNVHIKNAKIVGDVLGNLHPHGRQKKLICM